MCLGRLLDSWKHYKLSHIKTKEDLFVFVLCVLHLIILILQKSSSMEQLHRGENLLEELGINQRNQPRRAETIDNGSITCRSTHEVNPLRSWR